MSARCVMVLGTTSGAGKSWLATALCRWYARQGLKVAPFKAQNMSNNARVVAGGEIGSAQYFQALAARAQPEVRMNPLLLKPEKDTQSQVVLLGQVDEELSRMAWRGRSASVWPVLARALDDLRAEYDVIVIEGAGSPAEINLHDCDVVNMRVARHADARCLLVTDIDRGGAFAHLYGTWALLPEHERALIRGFVLNKFRGDAALLAPAPQILQELTGIPVVGTLPMHWRHGLPEEDGVFDMSTTLGMDAADLAGRAFSDWRMGNQNVTATPLTIAVIAYPRISNLDEFQPLRNVPGVRLVWARKPADCAAADCIILPGSKHTSSDLAWLRSQGLDATVVAHAKQGRPVLGICGGLQMLGETLIDPYGIDGNAPGLGLLPLATVFEPAKTVLRSDSSWGTLEGPWAALSGLAVQGYEIHHGQTRPHEGGARQGLDVREVMPGGLAWQSAAGGVLGCYLHGLFENPAVLQALFSATVPTLDTVFDGLADFLDQHLPAQVLRDLLG
jgi:adenosylcobyric acid synthase